MKTKICCKCGVEKPLTSEYFHRHRREKSGFHSACKECRNAINNEYREKNPDKGKNYYRENKERYNSNRKTNRIADKQRYYLKNKEKIKKYLNKYYHENKDIVLSKANVYYKNNREKRLEYGSDYYKTENGKQISAINRNKRRNRKKNSIATLTSKQWESCKKYFDYKCAYCGKENALEQEHFFPLSKGGEYTVKNIITSCKSCNSSKKDKGFYEWYHKQPFYSKARENKIMRYLEIKDHEQQISFF